MKRLQILGSFGLMTLLAACALSPEELTADCARLTAHSSEQGLEYPAVAFEDVDTATAIASCREANERAPSPRTAYGLGRALYKGGQGQNALVAFEQALSENYLPGVIHYTISDIYLSGFEVEKNIELALEHANTSLAVGFVGAHALGHRLIKSEPNSQ